MNSRSDLELLTLRDALLDLSRALGDPQRHLAILGEGNTSVDCQDGSFWVKASGAQLGRLDASGVSRVSFAAVEAMLEQASCSDAEVEQGLRDALLDPEAAKPSVETFLHALCLRQGGARWVGHTHTISVNQILCSQQGAQPFLQHIFPDAVVVCGRLPAVIPYVDPGFALAKAVQNELQRYQDAQGCQPKVLLMENHGIVALGQSATEVLNIMLMADKWARILQGSYALGGPRFMADAEVQRIDARLDEHYRRRKLSHA